MTQPIVGVMENRWVTVDGSRSLSYQRGQILCCKIIGKVLRMRTGIFFCVITTDVSFPRIPIAVCPEPEIALNAYSDIMRKSLRNLLLRRRVYEPTWYNRPSGEKTVKYLYNVFEHILKNMAVKAQQTYHKMSLTL